MRWCSGWHMMILLVLLQGSDTASFLHSVHPCLLAIAHGLGNAWQWFLTLYNASISSWVVFLLSHFPLHQCLCLLYSPSPWALLWDRDPAANATKANFDTTSQLLSVITMCPARSPLGRNHCKFTYSLVWVSDFSDDSSPLHPVSPAEEHRYLTTRITLYLARVLVMTTDSLIDADCSFIIKSQTRIFIYFSEK